ncbi:MAG TPA: rhodanese-like domain-containing protein [Desulfuromonadaceae bacterium]|nr:rhodanese-like domain-containing protein [Desulfuromonadaceae bacterium]
MKTFLFTSLLAVGWTVTAAPIPNPLIDYPGFQKIVAESAAEREAHRLTETQFIDAMTNPAVILLDARTASRYGQLHIRGAINLPFTEFTAGSLAGVIPTKTTPILIYCNNNFLGSPEAFASKVASASLNLSTYTSLRSYGYSNIFELGPLLDIKTTKIPFEGSEVK